MRLKLKFFFRLVAMFLNFDNLCDIMRQIANIEKKDVWCNN